MKSLILMGEQDNQTCISNEDEAEKIFRLKKMEAREANSLGTEEAEALCTFH